MTVIDTDKIKALLESDVTAYEIEKHTKMNRNSISMLRIGKQDITSLRLGNAIKLQKFWEEKTMTENYKTLAILGDYDILQNEEDKGDILIKYHENVRSVNKERYLTKKELDLLDERIKVYDDAEDGTERAEAQFSIEDLLKM